MCVFHLQLRQSDILKNLPDVEDEPITNTFDFEESNKFFDKEADNVESTGPAYKKSDFFDSLQERPNERQSKQCNAMQGGRQNESTEGYGDLR